MRKFILPLVVALGVGSAAPAMAFDSGDQISMEAALDIATGLGIRTVSHTQFLGDEWEIEGRDRADRWMKVYVDASTGDVRNVERGW
ncbi:PepSY domain-containing protein [Bradyrhizobium sp. CB82]|uniref:PepSY domain-containing protein n=1 Tax=Bradyrhizobium sp. CB82 TaxID=3039159 RepID=UPI0024B0DA17|nr:PepSY domain-containing protein [Bradyrhizobium sp. CB82]WFU41602.1 PepSY domain-containing protein [Bradyrhizobium sp. CB82]